MTFFFSFFLSTLPFFLSSAQSQSLQSTQIDLTLPTLRAISVSDSAPVRYHLPPLSSNIPVSISITLNICSPPSSYSGHLDPFYHQLLIVSNSSSNPSVDPHNIPNSKRGAVSSSFAGFANVTLFNSAGLWIYIRSPTPEIDQPWTMQLGIDTQPIHQVNAFPAFSIGDTDSTTALLTAADSSLFQAEDAKEPFPFSFLYPHIVPTPASLPFELSASLCALQLLNQSSTTRPVPLSQVSASLTTRNLGLYMPSSQATYNKTDRDYRILPDAAGKRTQYLISGLTPATNYTAWLFQPGRIVNSIQTGRLWPYVSFLTKKSNNCRLVHDLSFCPEIAYSVPAPPTVSTRNLINFYESAVTTHLQNFSTVLSTYPCNNDSSGRYSFVSGCADCLRAYTNWACAVVLPRCTDPPALPSIIQDSWTPQLVLNRADANSSRTPTLTNLSSSESFPYGEVPPCQSTCHLVAATCPPFLGWACPSLQAPSSAYGLARHLSALEVMGGEQTGSGGGGFRAADRFGNVFCNSLGSDLAYSRMGSGNSLRSVVGLILLSSLMPFLLSF